MMFFEETDDLIFTEAARLALNTNKFFPSLSEMSAFVKKAYDIKKAHDIDIRQQEEWDGYILSLKEDESERAFLALGLSLWGISTEEAERQISDQIRKTEFKISNRLEGGI